MTLTQSLILLAVLVLGGLAFHGWWSARKAAPRRAVPPPAAPRERTEPSLGGAVPAGPLEPTLGGAEPAFGGAVPAAAGGPVDPELAPLRPPPARRPARLDALIDAIATLTLEQPVGGEAAVAHLPPTRRVGTKPFHIEGLNAETGDWEPPAHGRQYSELQAGVQLANRHGALNEIEYSEFAQKVQAYAEGVGARADLPDMLDVVGRARELDQFASGHDAQLVMRLVAGSVAWSTGYVTQCAARHGFVPGAVPGRLVLPSEEEGAPPVLVLAYDAQAALADDPNQAALREVSLSLDVPQTPQSLEPYAAWQQHARRLAEDMDALLVDEAGQPITLHAFAAIDTELATLYKALESRDLAAGTAAARRLFS